jgi:hypothetical protein
MQAGLVNSGLYQVVGPFVPVHGGIFLLLPAPQNGVQAGRQIVHQLQTTQLSMRKMQPNLHMMRWVTRSSS